MTSLGLVVTELVTNSAKYGAGAIDVQFHMEDGEEGTMMVVLAVSDRGEGFPENFAFDSTGGLGSRLIDNIVRNSGGSVEIQRVKREPRRCALPPRPPARAGSNRLRRSNALRDAGGHPARAPWRRASQLLGDRNQLTCFGGANREQSPDLPAEPVEYDIRRFVTRFVTRFDHARADTSAASSFRVAGRSSWPINALAASEVPNTE